jgi:hypothetical protein
MPAVTEVRTKSTRACARVQQPAEKKDKFNNRLMGKKNGARAKKKLRRSLSGPKSCEPQSGKSAESPC